MTEQKKPTPIRKRTTKPPEPITFPAPKITQEIPHPEIPTQRLVPFPKPPISVELRNFIAHAIARTLYRVADWAEAEIATMGEAEFEALCRSILEDDEV